MKALFGRKLSRENSAANRLSPVRDPREEEVHSVFTESKALPRNDNVKNRLDDVRNRLNGIDWEEMNGAGAANRNSPRGRSPCQDLQSEDHGNERGEEQQQQQQQEQQEQQRRLSSRSKARKAPPPGRTIPPPPPRRNQAAAQDINVTSVPDNHRRKPTPSLFANYRIVDDRIEDDIPPPRRRKGRAKESLSSSEPPAQKRSPGLFADYQIEDDYRMMRNSAQDEAPSIRHPRKDRATLRRKTFDAEEGSKSIKSEESIELTRGKSERKVMPMLVRDPRNEPNAALRGGRKQAAAARSRKNSFTASIRAGEDDEDEPLTRPSAPVPRRRQNRSAAFNVGETRSSLITRLKDDTSARAFLGSMKSRQRHISSTSSLRTCLEDMGFNADDIETAIESTNAGSSKDAAKVVEWLGENQQGSGGGEQEDPEDESISVHSHDETNYTKHTYCSANTNITTNTGETEESDERVKELKSSLRDLGFSKSDINRHKETYRRHSSRMTTQDFLGIVFDVDPEDTAPSPVAQMEGGRKSKDITSDPMTDLMGSISEMGFEADQVESAVIRLRESGTRASQIDADKVLGVLLSIDSPAPPQPARNLDKSGEVEECVSFGESSHSNRAQSAKPEQQSRSESEKPLSIEITRGQYARLLKGRQTWHAMHNGTALSAQCIICNGTLQCCPEADYVLCPDCNVVSPLRAPAMDDGGMGNGEKKRSNSLRNVMQEDYACTSVSEERKSADFFVGTVGLGYNRESSKF